MVDDLIEAMGDEPTIRYKVLDHGFVECINRMGGDLSIVQAARISYKSEGRNIHDDKKLLMRLYKDMHTSPFEMGKIVFHIKLPIFVMRQFVRHRMQNLNEVSARYKQLPCEYYIPSGWRLQAPDKQQKQHTVQGDTKVELPYAHMVQDMDASEFATKDPSLVFDQYCKNAYVLYNEMLSAGIGRVMARMVLPVNFYTEIVTCWDLKNLLHFFRLRLDTHAQLEIRAFATAMYNLTKSYFPWCIEAFERFPMRTIDMEDTKA